MSTSRLDEIRAKLRASIKDATNQSIDNMLPESKRPSSTSDAPRPHSFCPMCGKPFTAPAKFCPGCGASQLSAASEPMSSARSLPANSVVARRSNSMGNNKIRFLKCHWPSHGHCSSEITPTRTALSKIASTTPAKWQPFSAILAIRSPQPLI